MELVQHYLVNRGVKSLALVFDERCGWHQICYLGENVCVEYTVSIFD